MSEVLLINERAGEFWNPRAVSETSRYGRLQGKEWSEIPPEEFQDRLDALSGKRILVLIHGLNNPKEQVISNYALAHLNVSSLSSTKDDSFLTKVWRMASYYLGFWEPEPVRPYDAIIGISWPSFDHGIYYYQGKEHAKQVANNVSEHLETLSKLSDEVDVMTHSMGTLVLFEALNKDRDIQLHNIYATAAAVPATHLNVGNKYGSVAQKCQKLFVLYSHQDEALLWPFYLAEEGRVALGLSGADHSASLHSNITSINCTPIADHHSAYFGADAIYQFIENQHNQTHTHLDDHTQLMFDSSGNLVKQQ